MAKNNNPSIMFTQNLVNDPIFKAARELINNPATRALQDLVNDPATRALQDLVNDPATRALQDLVNDPTTRAFQDFTNSSKSLLTYFQNIIPLDISQDSENLNAFFAEQLSVVFNPSISNNSTNESDYVIVNQKPIKEICVPDNLTIPIGNYRIKIKTEHFIAIISCILTLVIAFITSIPSSKANQTQEELLYRQAQQWQYQLLAQIFDSIDTSFSTQSEFINSFKEATEAQIKAAQKQEEAAEVQIKAAQAQERAAQAFEEAADSIREAVDSVKEPVHIESNK